MHIVVVEPHPDDAFLSLGWHLEKIWQGEERTILTVFSNGRRAAEASQYASAIGAGHLCLGLPETPLDNLGAPYERRPVPGLAKAVFGLKPDLLAIPLGLQHPDHKNVRAALDLRKQPMAYYFDTPYMGKKKLADELLSKARGMRILSIVYPSARKWKHIKVFKSQGSFFYFERPDQKTFPEILTHDCSDLHPFLRPVQNLDV